MGTRLTNAIDTVSPFVDVANCIGSGFRATVAMVGSVSSTVQSMAMVTRVTRIGLFVIHAFSFMGEVTHLTKAKERLIHVGDSVRLAFAMVEDVALLALAVDKLGYLSTQASSIALNVSFVAAVIQTVSIAIDSFRIHQLRNERKKIDQGPFVLEEEGKVSYKALYKLKRSAIEKKEVTNDLLNHLKTRITLGIALRSAAIVISVIGIIAVGILVFAPTPAAPFVWGTLLFLAVANIGWIVIQEVAYRSLDKEFAQLPNAVISDEKEDEFIWNNQNNPYVLAPPAPENKEDELLNRQRTRVDFNQEELSNPKKAHLNLYDAQPTTVEAIFAR